MMNRFTALALTPALVFAAASSSAATVTLLPADINGEDTSTTVFSNGDVTITPLLGGVASTFNGGAARLGIDGTGSNSNAFNDQNTTVGDADDETLQLAFSSTSGLSGLAYDFSRATGTGPEDRIRITGFAFDPTAAVTAGGTGISSLAFSGDTLSFQAFFLNDGTDTVIALDPLASAGQTLEILVNDTDQAGAQLAITSISYDNDVPEPGSLALLGLGSLLIARRRRA